MIKKYKIYIQQQQKQKEEQRVKRTAVGINKSGHGRMRRKRIIKLQQHNATSRMRKKRSKDNNTALIYLIPLHGGIFSLCVDLKSK